MLSHLHLRPRLLTVLTCITAVFAVVSSAPAGAAVTCDRVASPAGSDVSGDGSAANPFLSVSHLDASLSAGQTGCLHAGTYGDFGTAHHLVTNGAPGAPITITSYPGEQAKVVGWVDLKASYTTLSHLSIDGSNTLYVSEREGTSCPYPVSQGMNIDGHDDVLEHSDFYQSQATLRGNGIGIGWHGQADRVIVRFNRIHDVGQCMAYDHLIYLAHGDKAQIYGNWMWNDPHGFGVQAYPAPTNARIFSNVIDSTGSGLTINGASGTEVDHNVISNSTGLVNAGLVQGVAIQAWTPGPGDSAHDNLSFNNSGGPTYNTGELSLSNNATGDPQFANAGAHDYRVTSSSVSSWGLWDGDLGTASSAPPAPPTSTLPPAIAALPNLAANRSASASSSASPATLPARAVDGNPATSWVPKSRAQQWWRVDLGTVRRVGTVDINWTAGQSHSYRVEVSNNGRRWRRVATIGASASGWHVSRFAAVRARFVRVVDLNGNAPSELAIADVRVTAPASPVAGAARFRFRHRGRGARAARTRRHS